MLKHPTLQRAPTLRKQPARAAKSPARASASPPLSKKAATKKKPTSKTGVGDPPSSARLTLSFIAFAMLVCANLAQHYWHPPLSLVEEQAAKDLGGADWRNRFDPYQTTNGVKLWTPAHEARLQDYSGKMVYLTAITILGQCCYQGLSLLAEIAGSAAVPRLTTAVYSSAAFVNGFGVLVCCMFCFFWGLQTAAHPEWRAQWNFFESKGFHYMPLMVLVHLPSLVCGFIDVASKDKRLLAELLPSRWTLVMAVTAYHTCFETWLFINWSKCGMAIPYPWYYDIQLSSMPATNLVLYFLGINVMISSLVIAYRAFIFGYVGSPTKKVCI